MFLTVFLIDSRSILPRAAFLNRRGLKTFSQRLEDLFKETFWYLLISPWKRPNKYLNYNSSKICICLVFFGSIKHIILGHNTLKIFDRDSNSVLLPVLLQCLLPVVNFINILRTKNSYKYDVSAAFPNYMYVEKATKMTFVWKTHSYNVDEIDTGTCRPKRLRSTDL